MSSTHVKIGKQWMSVKILSESNFIEADDGSIIALHSANVEKPPKLTGQEAADLRAWLAGEPADVAAVDQVEELQAAIEDIAKVYDAWGNDPEIATFHAWFMREYGSLKFLELFRRVYEAHHS